MKGRPSVKENRGLSPGPNRPDGYVDFMTMSRRVCETSGRKITDPSYLSQIQLVAVTRTDPKFWPGKIPCPAPGAVIISTQVVTAPKGHRKVIHSFWILWITYFIPLLNCLSVLLSMPCVLGWMWITWRRSCVRDRSSIPRFPPPSRFPLARNPGSC